MNLIYIILLALFLWPGQGISASTAAAQSLEEKTESAKQETQKAYNLVLENGQSLEFDKKYLDQSRLLSAEMKFHPAVRTIPIKLYITKLSNPSMAWYLKNDVSLEDLRDILRVIAEQPTSAEQALHKLLFAEKPSWKRMILLMHIAIYFDIPALEKVMAHELTKEFAKHPDDKEYIDDILSLPDSIQAQLTSSIVAQNKTLQSFIQANYKPISMLFDGTTIYKKETAITRVAWSHDGKRIAFGLSNGVIMIDELATRKLVILKPYLSPVNTIEWSGDDTKLLTASHLQVGVWNTTSGALINEKIVFNIVSAAWADEDTHVAVATSSQLLLLDASTNEQLDEVAQPVNFDYRFVAWSPHARRVADFTVFDLDPVEDEMPVFAIAGPPPFLRKISDIEIKDVATGNVIYSFGRWNNQFIGYHLASTLAGISMAWSNDGTKLALSVNKKIAIWDSISSQIVTQFSTDDMVVAWSPNDKLLATHSPLSEANPLSQVNIGIWDMQNNEKILSFGSQGYKNEINTIAWSPESTKIVAGYKQGQLAIWDVNLDLLKLSLAQIQLLEKIIQDQKVEVSPDIKRVYWDLPRGWRSMLYQAYGKEAPSSALLKSRLLLRKLFQP